MGHQKIQVGRGLKMGKMFTSLSLTNVSIHLRLYKVDA